MKLYDQRVSKNISVSSAAFYTNFVYLILGMIFYFVEQYINPTGESYNTVFGIVEFSIVTLYWILIALIFFSRPGRTKSGTSITYLVFTLFPIIVFTVATVIIITVFPTMDFHFSWNILTWIVAPTLFWYLPFSYVYYSLGYYFTFEIFMGIVLAYIFLLLIIGMLFGFAWVSRVQEKEAAIKRHRERVRQQKRSRVTVIESESEESNEPIITEPQLDEKLYVGTNPFIGTMPQDDVEEESAIITEQNSVEEPSVSDKEKKKDEDFGMTLIKRD